jgi:hypothetical protein
VAGAGRAAARPARPRHRLRGRAPGRPPAWHDPAPAPHAGRPPPEARAQKPDRPRVRKGTDLLRKKLGRTSSGRGPGRLVSCAARPAAVRAPGAIAPRGWRRSGRRGRAGRTGPGAAAAGVPRGTYPRRPRIHLGIRASPFVPCGPDLDRCPLSGVPGAPSVPRGTPRAARGVPPRFATVPASVRAPGWTREALRGNDGEPLDSPGGGSFPRASSRLRAARSWPSPTRRAGSGRPRRR